VPGTKPTTADSRFGAVLRRYRVGASLSQEELAERSGLSVRGISDLERGARTSPRLETVRLISDALQLSSDDRSTLLAAARPEIDSPEGVRDSTIARTLEVPPPPSPPTRLVGRRQELEQILALFRTREARLITLTGQGGIGKSRLALAVARALSSEFSGGVTFIDLSTVRDPAMIPGAIAVHLDVRPEPGERAVDALIASIDRRSILLVLDNWEHVLPAATLVSDLLAHCEHLAVLATSRERLRLRGEWEIPLEPLAVPEVDAQIDPAGLMELPAIRLFVDRASESAHGFTLTGANASEVITICRRLEGLPLAIELAAARSSSLGITMLLNGLASRLDLLKEGPRDLPVRQQTMRNAISWSYELLDPAERTILSWLSVFVGGFSMDAAVAVCRAAAGNASAGDAVNDEYAVRSAITSLIEKSLMKMPRIDATGPRVVMSETIREFALERLRELDQGDQLADAHAWHFLSVAERAEPALMGPDPMPVFHELERDMGNLRAALSWLQAQGRTAEALRLVGALAWFWTEPRYLREGREWYEALLTGSETQAPPEVRAKALVAAGDLAQWQFDTDAALAYHEEGARLWREVGDAERIAGVLRSLATVALEQRAYERAEELLSESRTLALQVGNSWEVAATTNLIGVSELFRGQPADAIERHQQAVQIWEELGDLAHVVAALGSLGWAYLQTGQLKEASAAYARAIEPAIDQEDIVQISWCFTGAAVLALLRDSDAVQSATLFAAADRARKEAGTPTWASTREAIERYCQLAREQAGDPGFDQAWEEGAGLSTEEAEAIARSVLTPTPPAT
jgi:predicted ATPase/DNA-binding XRE family transcriptional regulator